MCFVCVCLNRWVWQASPSFIHSFKHSLAVKLFSHNQILMNPKSNGLVYNVCVKNMSFLYGVCRCIDLKVQLTAVSVVLSKII